MAAMLRASTRKSSSSRMAAANPLARPTAPTARAQRARSSSRTAIRSTMSRSRSTVARIPGRCTFTATSAPAPGPRHAKRLAYQLLYLLPPGRLGPVLQPGELGNELWREQVTASGQQLAQLGEGNAALLQGAPQRHG